KRIATPLHPCKARRLRCARPFVTTTLRRDSRHTRRHDAMRTTKRLGATATVTATAALALGWVPACDTDRMGGALTQVEQRVSTPGTWQTLTHSPPTTISTSLLMTDGSVLAQETGGTKWYRLAPDASGSYLDGTWSQAASMSDSRLYYGSAVLP